MADDGTTVDAQRYVSKLPSSFLHLEDADGVGHRRRSTLRRFRRSGVRQQAVDIGLCRRATTAGSKPAMHADLPRASAGSLTKKARLHALEREHLEEMGVVVRWDTSLLVVVGKHELVSSGCPLAPLRVGHRRIGSHAMRGVLIALVMLVFAAGCGGSDGATDTTTEASAECESVDAPEARDPGSNEAPTTSLDAAKTYTLTFDTVQAVHRDPRPRSSRQTRRPLLVALAEEGYSTTRSSSRRSGSSLSRARLTQIGRLAAPALDVRRTSVPTRRTTIGVVAMAKSGPRLPGRR